MENASMCYYKTFFLADFSFSYLVSKRMIFFLKQIYILVIYIYILFFYLPFFIFRMNSGNNLPIGLTHCIIVKRSEVYMCHLFGTVPQAFAYHGDGYSFFFGGGGPAMARYVGCERYIQAQHFG